MSDYQFVEGAPMTEAMIRIFGDAFQDFMFVFVGGIYMYMYVWRGFHDSVIITKINYSQCTLIHKHRKAG